MQTPRSLPLTADDFIQSFVRITSDGYHLSSELQRLFRVGKPTADQAHILRHRLYQALRYNDCHAAWSGALDNVVVPAQAFTVPWLPTNNPSWLLDAPTFIRVNTLKTTVIDCCRSLAPYHPQHVVDECVRIDAPFGLFTSAAFANGWFEQQDINSQRVCSSIRELVLSQMPVRRVIDVCAGAGGKSLHLAALTGNRGHILAMDIDNVKLEQLRIRAARAGADCIETRHVTSTKILKRQYGKANLVVVDAPCSGSGVLRRNPDILYHLTETDLAELQTTQTALIQRALMMCEPNGYVAYVTCSTLPAEGTEQVQDLVREGLACVVHEWQTDVNHSGGDGFYFCLIQPLQT